MVKNSSAVCDSSGGCFGVGLVGDRDNVDEQVATLRNISVRVTVRPDCNGIAVVVRRRDE